MNNGSASLPMHVSPLPPDACQCLPKIIHVVRWTRIYIRLLLFFKRENVDVPVRPHTSLEQYCCPRNSDSYFVNIGYDRTAISFVDLHTVEFKSNIVLKQYVRGPHMDSLTKMRPTYLLRTYGVVYVQLLLNLVRSSTTLTTDVLNLVHMLVVLVLYTAIEVLNVKPDVF